MAGLRGKVRAQLIETLLAMDEESAKDEVLDLLVRPYEELAKLFADGFENFNPVVKMHAWSGPIELAFHTRIPSSDTIRNVIFSLYDIVWGGKPDGLECVYRGLIGSNQYHTEPVFIFITTDPKSISQIISGSRRCTVLDDQEYALWKKIENRHREANRVEKVEQLKKDGHVFDTGQPLPVFRSGLFKI